MDLDSRGSGQKGKKFLRWRPSLTFHQTLRVEPASDYFEASVSNISRQMVQTWHRLNLRELLPKETEAEDLRIFPGQRIVMPDALQLLTLRYNAAIWDTLGS